MIGDRISHYKILEKLGSGGMGVVYKAEDTRLKRTVALKFLPSELTCDPEAKERFVQEAQAASALDHPNICTVHEIDETQDGRMFMVMSYYKGETLKKKIEGGPLDPEAAVGIAAHVARELVRAHEQGIVHRDIKPANILLAEDGQVKIVDFGLAKLAGQARLTRTGTTVGTVAYMSPEQARGEAVDHRADIWPLGVILYEMVTGQLPFRGEYEQAVIYSILNEDPEPAASIRTDISGDLDEIIGKALAKDPAQRHQHIQELLKYLEALTPIPTSPQQEKSIVVLPFEDISPGRDNEYFSDGLTEEIITDLSKVRTLRVISRNSAMALKGTRKNTMTIGRELNVKYVLEGSVRKAGNNLRITAQLIDATNDAHMWAEKYSGTLEDVFDIQEKVSRSIVDSLKLKLSPEEDQRMAERPIPNVHAYECYLRARREVLRFTEDGLERALQYLQNGLDIAGENALLYAGMGYVYWQYVNIGFRQEDYVEKVEECAKKVFQLEPDLPQGHILLGLIHIMFRGDPQQGARHLKKVLAVNPNDFDGLLWLSVVYQLAGKTSAAFPMIKKIMEIDPLNSASYIVQGVQYYYEGQFDIALDSVFKGLQMEPDNPVFIFLYIMILGCNQRIDDAVSFIDENIKTASQHICFQMSQFLKYALQGDNNVSHLLTDEFIATTKRDAQYSFFFADFYALLDRKTEALDWLENAINRGLINYSFLSEYDPFLENIREEERFKRLMERVKYEWEHFEI